MRQILLHVLGHDYRDPMHLVATTSADRAAASKYSRTFELIFDPPPDTLFMRGTGLDLGVFGEDLPAGHLQSIDAAHARPILERAVGEAAEHTVESLITFAGKLEWRDAVAAALTTGTWAADADARRGALVQAAGFAKQLGLAVRHALPIRGAVVWEYTGGRCSYDYPAA